jgi:hypothetical protein
MNDVDRIARLIERRLPLRILQLVEDDEPERSPLQKLWDTATKHETWKACMAKAVGEVSPPGWEGTVKAMKGHPDISNPWALAWWMDGQGMSSHKESEGGPGSGRKGGAGGGKQWVPPKKPLITTPEQRAAKGAAIRAFVKRTYRGTGTGQIGKQSDESLEGGPGSGRKGGGAGKYVPQHIANARADQARLQRHDRAEKGRRAALKRGARGDNSTLGILRQRGYDV